MLHQPGLYLFEHLRVAGAGLGHVALDAFEDEACLFVDAVFQRKFIHQTVVDALCEHLRLVGANHLGFLKSSHQLAREITDIVFREKHGQEEDSTQPAKTAFDLFMMAIKDDTKFPRHSAPLSSLSNEHAVHRLPCIPYQQTMKVRQ